MQTVHTQSWSSVTHFQKKGYLAVYVAISLKLASIFQLMSVVRSAAVASANSVLTRHRYGVSYHYCNRIFHPDADGVIEQFVRWVLSMKMIRTLQKIWNLKKRPPVKCHMSTVVMWSDWSISGWFDLLISGPHSCATSGLFCISSAPSLSSLLSLLHCDRSNDQPAKPRVSDTVKWNQSALTMVMNTFTVGVSVTPTVIKTYASHVRCLARNKPIG